LPSGIDIRTFRKQQASRPRRRYEVVGEIDERAGAADTIMREGWVLTTFPPVKLDPPIAWDEVCASNRSWHYHLHCWDALGPVLAAYDRTRDRRYLDFAVDVAVDWITQYPSTEVSSDFAWYDMAVGLRAYRLAYILDSAARSERQGDDVIETLTDSLLLHAAVLDEDDRFAWHSNHGIYQAAGQLALARRFPDLPGMAETEQHAMARLRDLMRRQFTAEGVHREHSPGYHRMLLETITGLLVAGVTEDPELWELRDKAEEALAWFVLPNGRLAMFGDTAYESPASPHADGRANDAFRFVVTGGKAGKPPAASTRCFPESGYAVMRDRWPDGPGDYAQCSYLAQICAFHSRAHKHADDLSFVWYDRGAELVTDAGRFGYLGTTDPSSELAKDGFWYSHPSRVYVESTKAHNTVEIDRRSFERKRVKPYGSSLLRWGEQDGIHFTEAQVWHRRSIRHARTLLFKPRDWLIVFDWLWDNLKQPHTFTQRFHFAPELEAARVNEQVRLTVPGVAAALFVAPLLPTPLTDFARGQEEPELLGWVSRREREMTPCCTVGYGVDGAAYHTFAALLTFSDAAPRPLQQESRSNTSGRVARFRWEADGSGHTVELSRPQDGDVGVSYRVSPL
jgi:hypothetical protein